MNLSDMLQPAAVSVALAATNKDEAIRELVDLLARSYPIGDKEKVLAAVFAREELISTGIGNGVAIPHAKVESAASMMISFGLKPNGIDFQSIDGQAARVFFMIIAPKDANANETHLKVMARVSRLLKNELFCRELLACASPADVIARIAGEENRIV